MSTQEEPVRPVGDNEESELAACRLELAELRAAHQRLAADLANLRERHRREFAGSVQREAGALMRDWLEVVDDLERALEASRGASEASLRQGLELVLSEARNVLQQRGLERFESVGQGFDPQRHEAVGTSEDASDGSIHAELRPGYLLGGAVLRPAEVIVGKGRNR